MNGFIRGLFTLVAVLALAGATPADAAPANGTGPPQPSTPGPVYFQIQAEHTGKCLDVLGAGPDNGAPVVQWACQGSSQLNQLWRLVGTGDGSTYYIRAYHSSKCLDVLGAGTTDGTAVVQWDCMGYQQANQRWEIIWRHGNYYTIRPAHIGGRCLDVFGVATEDGAPVVQWTCVNGSEQVNQHWLLISA